MCVFSAADPSNTLLDRTFAGNVNRFVLPHLFPNTAYIIRSRSSNVLGEWSLWSEDRVVYTMKPIITNVVTVGENYISINWGRDAPDELSDVVRGEQKDVDLDSLVEAEYAGDDSALKALQMRKQYPLLDRPQTVSPVYVSSRTNIVKYCVSVSRHQDTTSDPWTTLVDGNVNYFKIPQLNHNTVYTIAVRACYGEEDWGIWSEKIKSGTLHLLQVNVKNIGEDYFAAEWRRIPNTFSEFDVSTGRQEETLCYQFRVHDFTEVPIGGEAQADLNSLIVQDIHLTSKHNVFKGLKPNRRYQLAVRRWYRPASLATPQIQQANNQANASNPSPSNIPSGAGPSSPNNVNPSADGSVSASAPLSQIAAAPSNNNAAATNVATEPKSEEAQLRRLIETAGGLEGTWSDAVTIVTLKEMVVLVNEISESGMLIRWERDPEATSYSTRQGYRPVVHSYHLRIDEMLHDGSALDNGQQSLHFDQQFQAEDTSFRVKDLKPDAVYRIEVRCCADKVWGLWSRHVLAITLPRLHVTVTSLGEDYASLSWERKIRYLTANDGTVAVTGNVANVEKYELEMNGLDHHFQLPKKFKASRTTYRVKHLEPSMVYSVVMRSCDADEEWSVWSDRVTFATLKPLQLQFGKIAEQFVHVSWGRQPQTSEEYRELDKNVIIGPTEALSYHFCVFSMDQMPSAAIVDKQFRGDVTKFRVDNLNPNTSYIMIVRACNSEQHWGLWSEERVVTTQRVLSTSIVSIGENYVAVRWSRLDAEAENRIVSPKNNVASAQRKQPTSFHLCLTSEADTIDRKFSSEECTYTADEERTPMYTIRALNSDTKYILSLQACYGGEEWGMWSTPITFMTMSTISVKVANITENSAEFTWGRAQQNPQHAADPNVLVWRGTIVRYQLLLRKVDEMRAQEMREREKAMAEAELQKQVQQLTGGDAAFASGSHTVPTTMTNGVVVPMTQHSSHTRPDADPSSVPHFFFEQEMDVRLVKYVQTLSRIDRLEVNTEYHFQVRALDDHNEWGYWSEVFFDTPPNPPQNLVMRKDGALILLSWDPPSRAHNYMYCIEQAVGRDPSVTKEGAAPARGAKKDGSTMDWRVVDTVEDTMCRMRAFGPINRVRCRIKCCKVNTPTYLFSRYSAVVTLSSSLSVEPVADLRLTSLSKSAAIIEWAKADAKAPEPGSPTVPAPPPPKISYRVMLAVNTQPLINVATLRATTFELTDLSPSTNYVVQVIPETEGGSCQRNPTLKFTTKAESDRGVYKCAPGQLPLGELIPPPQDRTLLLLGSTGSGTNSGSPRLPNLEKSGPLTPKPPQQSRKGNTPPPASPTYGGSTPRGTSGSSGLLTPATTGRRAPGTAPHGATRSNSKKGANQVGGGLLPTVTRTGGQQSMAASSNGQQVPLPPVSQRPASGSSAVEHFDYVGFVPSDDEK